MNGLATAQETPLAIICGGGSIPFAVADAVLKQGRRVVLFGLRGFADAAALARFSHHWIAIGQIGRFRRLMDQEQCRDVVMIGSLVRPSLFAVRLDWQTIKMMPRTIRAFRGGDDHLLSGVARIFADLGYRLVGAHEVAPDILFPLGPIGAGAPRERDVRDIAHGLDVLAATGRFDIGQAVVVAGGHVLALEGAEGTDGMLDRVAEMRRSGRIRIPRGVGVLVKAPKPGQNRRLDLPSVGPATIEGAARAGLAGIALVAGGTVMAEPARLAEVADREKLFVIGVPEGKLESNSA